eukprot:g36548.t1
MLSDSASTALYINKFHRVTTLWLKKFLIISVLKSHAFTLRLFPQVLVSLIHGNIFSKSTLNRPLSILSVLIRSPLILPNSNEYKLSIHNHSSYSKLFNCGSILVNFLWIPSKASTSLDMGSKTIFQM